jgi:HEXXH motif-containing protein
MLTDRQRELEGERQRAVLSTVRRVRGYLAPNESPLDNDVLARHPLAALIYRVAAREGPSGRGAIEAANEAFSTRCRRDAARMRHGQLLAIQSSLVLVRRDTRDATLSPAPREEAELEKVLDRHAQAVAHAMPRWWPEFVRIATSYTSVTVNGRPAPPRFSGTYSDAAGAIHGAEPMNAEVYVEILTHESGHLWLNLLADQDPEFIRNPYTEQDFVSPWRSDARPIHGIVHGVYVFSAVIPALIALRTDTAHARAAQLAAQVTDAVRQLAAFGSLSREAVEIVREAEARVLSVESTIGNGPLAAARERYAANKARKVECLRNTTPRLRVV